MAIPTNITPPARRFIKRQDVESITGLSCTEIYRRIAAGAFPKQVTLGPKCVAWIEAEIHTWCDEQIAASRGEVA
ncbi:MAG: helix-turn-helix transcriptional regulator [Pseudomonas palmensis]|uniref:helix-turn-helix transcriptional regulator n=1 Tax=Pseudomonas palmensis TaxID=2815362 RepID=UPI003D0C8B1F